jgi:hypothetical protein
MTAIRVVENHLELENIGELPHADIDNLLTGSSFLVVTTPSGSLGSARVLAAGPGITINDGGPGGLFEISASAVSTEIVWNEIPGGTLDDVNKAFTLEYQPTNPRKLMFFRNGQLMLSGANGDYLLSGSTMTFNNECIAPGPSEVLLATYERTL